MIRIVSNRPKKSLVLFVLYITPYSISTPAVAQDPLRPIMTKIVMAKLQIWRISASQLGLNCHIYNVIIGLHV